MVYRNIGKFNLSWTAGRITQPLIILIGGYCGTGKTTLANLIQKKHIPFINIAGIGVIRAILRSIIPKGSNIFLHKHTYDLYKYGDPTPSLSERVIGNFFKQVEPINKAIYEYIRFTQTEKQCNIIEGPQIVPGNLKIEPGWKIIEFYLKNEDPKSHYKMMCGSAHNRNLNDNQFNTARLLQEYLLETASDCGKMIFNCKESFGEPLKYIDSCLANLYEL